MKRHTNRIHSQVVSALALLGLTALAGLPLSGQGQAAPQAPGTAPPATLAIKGGTVLTVTGGTIPNGTVLVRAGRIAAVGAEVPIPPGAEVVDATGKFVSPGIVDEHSHIAESSTNEGGTTVSSMTNVLDVLDPRDVNIYRDLAGGLTVASVFHGSANPIGGTNTVIKLRWGKERAEDLVFDAALPGLKFALGENPKDMRQFGQTGPRRYPVSRPGVEFVIRDAFTRARAYQREWQRYQQQKTVNPSALAPRRDLQLEPLVEVLEGTRLAHVHAYRSDEMLMMLRLAEEFGFKVATFEHGLEGYKVAKELAAHGAGVGTFSDWWGFKIEAIDAIPYNAALMMKAGVVVSINSDSAEHARRLNTEAAKMMKWGGLTEDQALALVTINPARQLKIDRRVGSLEAGKDADLVIWTRHPLSSYAVVERTYIDGTLYYDRAADLARVARVEKEKADLVAAERPAEKPAVPAPDANGDGAGNGNGATRSAAPPAGAPPEDNAAVTALAPRMTPGYQVKGVLAITNARIHPISGPAIERGTVVVRDGRIEAVGAAVPVPSGAKVIDASGGDVYPGWINARTTVGLSEPGARGYEDTAEMLDYNPQLRTVVAYHNDSESIPVARANGVTTVAVFPTGGVLGGQVPVMNLDGWTWEESTLRPIAGITFQFPAVGAGGRGGAGGGGSAPGAGEERTYEQLKKERDARLDALARLFDQARAYARANAGERERDWVLEALVPVVSGRMPLFTAAARAQDIRDAVAFAARTGVRTVICSGPEAALVAPLLKEKDVPVMNLDGWTWEESTLRPIAGITFQFPAVGAGGRGGAGGGGPAPGAGEERTYEGLKKERDARLDALARLFDQARAYARANAGERERDWVLEALVPVVSGRMPLFTAAARAQDIRDAVAFAARTGVRIVICSGPEAALVAPLLKEKDVPVILGSILALPTREDQFHAASYQAAAELAKAGVRFAFATGDNANVRQVPYQAAMSIAWGLPRDAAIRALTLDAATILGVQESVGSIEPGKVANLLIARGDPLEVRTEMTHVIINGQDVDLGNKHLALYERYLKRQ